MYRVYRLYMAVVCQKDRLKLIISHNPAQRLSLIKVSLIQQLLYGGRRAGQPLPDQPLPAGVNRQAACVTAGHESSSGCRPL